MVKIGDTVEVIHYYSDYWKEKGIVKNILLDIIAVKLFNYKDPCSFRDFHLKVVKKPKWEIEVYNLEKI